MEFGDHIQRLAVKKNCQPSQLALAWVLAQGDDIVPIILGTKQRSYLEENVAATKIQLTPDNLKQIPEIVPVRVCSRITVS